MIRHTIQPIATQQQHVVSVAVKHQPFNGRFIRSRRRLLLIKDSYANSFLPFLTQDFREIVVVDPRYYFGNVKDLIRNEGVTDVLFLYNDNTFMTDESLSLML